MSRLLLAAVGMLLVASGLGVVAAWAVASQPAIQLQTQLQPFHYNPALLVAAWGCGLVAVAGGFRRAAGAIAVAVAAGGVAALAAVGGGPPLNEWAFPADPLLPPVPNGGMPLPAAVGFVLAGVGLWLAARPRPGRAAAAAALLLALALTFGAAAAVVNSPLVLGAGNALGPPLLLCVCLFAGGAVGVARGLPAARTLVPPPLAVPGGVWCGGVAFAVIVWHGTEAREQDRLRRLVQFDAAETRLVAQNALEDCAYRLAGAAQTVRAKRDAALDGGDDLSLYLGARHVRGVARVDGDGRLRWNLTANPQQLPATVAGLGADAVVEAVRQGRPAAARPPRSLWNGNWVMVFYAPLQADAPAAGGMLAVIQTRPFLDAVLANKQSSGYALEVSDGADVLYVRGGHGDPAGREYAAHERVQVSDLAWEVRQWPTPDFLDREKISVARLVLGGGVGLVSLLALAISLAQTARRRAAALEAEVRERTTAEAALRVSEARSRSLIDNLRHGVFLKDEAGRYVAANPAFCRMVGRAEGDLVGRRDEDFLPADKAARWAVLEARVRADGHAAEVEESCTVDGHPRTIRRQLTPLRDAAGADVGILGIRWDVTDERALEARIQQASKLDALGQLAGGIAHDFNNLLTAIVGNLELVRLTLPTAHAAGELLDAAQGAADRASALTGRLLGFARQHNLDRRVVQVEAVVAEVVSLLRRTIDPRVRLEATSDPAVGRIEADPNQLNQVLMNLCINARDAIHGPGSIRIHTEGVVVDAARAGRHNAPPGRYVRLSVTDTGGGMTPETQARMFDPFFTTKEVGKGTGLGLAMVFGIVQGHHGWIECDSRLGAGTRFDLYFPETTQAEPVPTTPAAEPAAADSAATILLADDEEMIRRMAAMVLRENGYEVLEVADGEQAVSAFERDGDRIDLAVLDLTMPVLSGQDAFREIIQRRPSARVIFASGYASEQLDADETRRIAGYLKKPYRPHELLTRVREALGA